MRAKTSAFFGTPLIKSDPTMSQRNSNLPDDVDASRALSPRKLCNLGRAMMTCNRWPAHALSVVAPTSFAAARPSAKCWTMFMRPSVSCIMSSPALPAKQNWPLFR
ncbi:hypothetical protein AMC87_PC00271 (plasmid) [Rhizobium phaseoli]|uniref:Hypothetical conserved protein n=1 Tax=Rhizobium etli (strain CIAT 652) TaxID=491916 RepID=B3Q2Q1_RHIE6|nr:hypothetical conserved protein [Rhizobium etli CIAT 652]ANL24593.1 hypothetical protein AMJ96_PB00281 [Rhizobium sp. N113]ANL49966.1 hypothetical protein AMC87_PC00271 [Rhizobium phaseoli]KKZ84364.1 hypothetical protein RPHASCH2410_PC00045 [Rhizobium phaseoli Ch24-10]